MSSLRRSTPRSCAIAIALLGMACSSDDPRRAQAEKALEDADAIIAEGKERAAPLLEDASTYARSWMPELPSTGELSDQAVGWIGEHGGDEARVEYWLDKGKQSVPVAKDIGRTLNAALERDFVIEPIYRPIEQGADLAKIDASIAAMPRVEVIEGLTIGFRSMAADDVEGREKQKAFLVMWRAEENLVGFVFRSRRKIRVDKLVEQTPRLVKLVQGVIG